MAMDRIELAFFSETLGVRCSLTALVPQGKGLARDRDIPVLWLLHGHSDDHTIWSRATSIERYADARGLAVVMPAVGLSWYTNMKAPLSQRYRDFIADDVPAVVRSLLPVSSDRSKNYVAGLSMGGYGAMKMGLLYPERYAYAASLSGVVDISALLDGPHDEPIDPVGASEFASVFGSPDALRESDDNLMRLVEKRVSEKADLPELFLVCGTEDFLYANNQNFRRRLESLGVAHEYKEEPGTHEWGFWDRWIRYVVEHLPIPKE